MNIRLPVITTLLILVSFVAPVIGADDILCLEEINTCPPSPDPCMCDLASPLSVIGPPSAVVDTDYDPLGGRQDYSFTIPPLSPDYIDSKTGTILKVPKCPSKATVTAEDACKETYELKIVLPPIYEVSLAGPAIALKDSVYTGSQGALPYTYSIDKGSIDSQSGIIDELPHCSVLVNDNTGIVKVADDCEQKASLQVTFQKPTPVSISGREIADIGTVYTASGGEGPYTYSFDKGTIDSQTGEITGLSRCIPGEPRWATVTVTDDCEQSSTKEVRLPDGYWANIVTDFKYTPGYQLTCFGAECGSNTCVSADGFTSGGNDLERTTIAGGTRTYETGYGRTKSYTGPPPTEQTDIPLDTGSYGFFYDIAGSDTVALKTSLGYGCGTVFVRYVVYGLAINRVRIDEWQCY